MSMIRKRRGMLFAKITRPGNSSTEMMSLELPALDKTIIGNQYTQGIPYRTMASSTGHRVQITIPEESSLQLPVDAKVCIAYR